MKLIATPRSHFSRKVRLLLDHLGLPYELIDVGNVAADELEQFAGNPVMGVPVLEDGDVWMIESDHIARYIAKKYDANDRFAALTEHTDQLNARAVMNGVMANEVKLILSARMGLDPDDHAYFRKAKSSIKQGLSWLEGRPGLFSSDDLSYADFHFISMWDHLELYGLVALDYPSLKNIKIALNGFERVRMSAPPDLD